MWNEGGYLFNEDGEIVADDKVTAVFDKYAELYKDKVIPAGMQQPGMQVEIMVLIWQDVQQFVLMHLHYIMHWYLMNNIKNS